MNSNEVLAYLSDAIREHNLQTAIRNMLEDKVWASVISPSTKEENLFFHKKNENLKNQVASHPGRN